MNITEEPDDRPRQVRSIPPAVVLALRERFQDQFSQTQDVCNKHCATLTWLSPQPPEGVVYCKVTDDICDALRICHASAVPVIAFGAGTSLEGQTNAPVGGICLDMSGMNEILEVNAVDGYAIVQPGLSHSALNESLEPFGMFFPVDPGSSASLGGMAATRASGTNSVRYGTMRDNTLALQVVSAEGTIFRTGTLAKKSASGYDLTRLVVGSEGTLGVITQLTVRLFRLPKTIAGGRCTFKSIESAIGSVVEALREQIDFARIELLDELAMRACNIYSNLILNEVPTLFFEFHGDSEHVSREAHRWRAIVEKAGGSDYQWSNAQEERTQLWAARHDAWWAIHELFPGRRGVTTDVCVPVSKLHLCVNRAKEQVDSFQLHGVIIGHVGDGNFHVLIMLNEGDLAECARARGFISHLNILAIELGGTCSGEHGVGQGKMQYAELEHGCCAVAMMASIKNAFDPKGILNPGKLFRRTG